MTRRVPHADLVLLVITALWGTTFALIQQGLAHAGTFTFLAMRFAIGAVALAILARFRIFAWRANLAGFGLGCLSFLGFALQTGGLRWTTAPRSAFLTGLTVVLVPVVGAFVARRPSRGSVIALAVALLGLVGASWGGGSLPPTVWAGLMVTAIVGLAVMPALPGPIRAAICLAVAGLALMTRPVGTAPSATLKGDLLTLGCTVAFGLSILLSERIAPKHAVMPMVFGHLVAMGLLSAVAIPFVGWRLEPCRELWVSLAFCGVVASAVCIAGQTFAMQRTTATRAALIYALEPVFAAMFAYAWKGEVLGRAEAMGGACIVAATLLDPVRRAILGMAERPTAAQPTAE